MAAFRTVPEIRRHQIIQDSVEDINVRLVSTANVDEAVTAVIKEIFGYLPAGLKITYLDDIPPLPNGKFQFSICRI
jgi:hypothetical protein